jgi:valyl-tRNA synthetase
VLDPAKERARLEALRDKIAKQIAVATNKLGNASFVERAPADVVEQERQRLVDFQAELRAIEANLAALD